MSWWMITVVEKRDIVTRVALKEEERARVAHKELRSRKDKEKWLSVTLSQVEAPPVRGVDEKARAVRLLYT